MAQGPRPGGQRRRPNHGGAQQRTRPTRARRDDYYEDDEYEYYDEAPAGMSQGVVIGIVAGVVVLMIIIGVAAGGGGGGDTTNEADDSGNMAEDDAANEDEDSGVRTMRTVSGSNDDDDEDEPRLSRRERERQAKQAIIDTAIEAHYEAQIAANQQVQTDAEALRQRIPELAEALETATEAVTAAEQVRTEAEDALEELEENPPASGGGVVTNHSRTLFTRIEQHSDAAGAANEQLGVYLAALTNRNEVALEIDELRDEMYDTWERRGEYGSSSYRRFERARDEYNERQPELARVQATASQEWQTLLDLEQAEVRAWEAISGTVDRLRTAVEAVAEANNGTVSEPVAIKANEYITAYDSWKPGIERQFELASEYRGMADEMSTLEAAFTRADTVYAQARQAFLEANDAYGEAVATLQHWQAQVDNAGLQGRDGPRFQRDEAIRERDRCRDVKDQAERTARDARNDRVAAIRDVSDKREEMEDIIDEHRRVMTENEPSHESVNLALEALHQAIEAAADGNAEEQEAWEATIEEAQATLNDARTAVTEAERARTEAEEAHSELTLQVTVLLRDVKQPTRLAVELSEMTSELRRIRIRQLRMSLAAAKHPDVRAALTDIIEVLEAE